MAGKRLMRCPKCSRKLTNKIECRNCGLLFERYAKAQARKKAEEEARAARKAKAKQQLTLALTVVLAIVLGGTGYYYFTRPQPSSPTITEGPTQTSAQSTAPQQPAAQQERQSAAAALTAGNGDSPASIDKDFINLAKQATVSITTPWGSGSGFFIKKDMVITNKHVVEYNKERFEENKMELKKTRKMLELENDKLEDMKKHYKTMPKGPSKSQLAIMIKDGDELLKKHFSQLEEREKQLAEVRRRLDSPDIVISLSDGGEFRMGYMVTSSRYDLALLTVYNTNAPSIKIPPSGTSLEQGDTVYTIGSPMGLNNTVTSGVFSGYRQGESSEERYLQTDAAINPGNSGGPLIDEEGYVRGVNTMILKNSQGIGFAIPIDAVINEFNL